MPHAVATNREPLLRLYQQYVTGELPHDDALAAIDLRSKVAADLYALDAAEIPDVFLDDYIQRLAAASDPNTALDAAVDATEREVARVQRDVLEHEQQRRLGVRTAIERGERYAPPRPELLASLMGFDNSLRQDGIGTHFGETFRKIVAATRRALLNEAPGTSVVVRVLRDAAALAPEGVQHPIDPWMRAAVALELLTNPKGFGGVHIEIDPVTIAEASRAKRLFYATGRQDPRYEQVDWPLDLSGDEVATLMANGASAAAAWALHGFPESDRIMYTTPTRREEIGRPEPSPFVVPEAQARRLAQEAKGAPEPFVFPIHPRERARVSRELWEQGIPAPAKNQVGTPLYAAPGQLVGWGYPPFPFGVMCAVALPDNFILRLGRPGNETDEELFNQISDQAAAQATGEQDYPRILRELLLKHGFHAIARYDYVEGETAHPQEMILLDPRPETTMIVRESVPSFMQGDRRLEVPQPREQVAPRAPARSTR